jgi:quercetin dioxygenase-like cupin family protein
MAAAMLLAGCSVGAASVGNFPIKRTDILRQELSDATHEAVQARVDFAPGAMFGVHVHPGIEIAYVLEGSLEYQIEGRPPIVLRAGDALFIPAGARHAARNVAAGQSSELATYLVEKGKPLVVSAPNRNFGPRGSRTPKIDQ